MLRPLILGDGDRAKLLEAIHVYLLTSVRTDEAFGKIVDEVERIAETHADTVTQDLHALLKRRQSQLEEWQAIAIKYRPELKS